MTPTLSEALARHLFVCQPGALRSRLLNNERFARVSGVPRRVVTVKSVGMFAADTLFRAAREVLSAGGVREIASIDGRTANVSLEGDAIIISAEPQLRIAVRELMALSQTPERRLSALRGMKEWLGPTAKDVAVIAGLAEERPITDDEMLKIQDEMGRSVARWHARLESALAAETLSLAEVAPEEFMYYEKLIGPRPGNYGPEEYIRDVLQPYRHTVVETNPRRGLDICLLSCLREDLALGTAVGSLTESEVWEIIKPYRTAEDPFTQLGALEIAATRTTDSRFVGLAEELVNRLMSRELRRDDGTDVYELMPSMASAIFRSLNVCENGGKIASYWRRAAAWAQAGVVIRGLQRSRVEGAGFVEWLDQSGPSAGHTRILVDLRSEPMRSAFEMTSDRLRGEVLGRVFKIVSSWERSGVPLPENIRARFARDLADSPEVLLQASMPGPLEGHRRSGIAHLLEGHLTEATHVWFERLQGPQCRQAWAFLGQIAQVLAYENAMLVAIRDRVRTVRVADEPAEGEVDRDALGWAAMIAAAHRDEQLGDVVGERCVAEAERAESTDAAALLFHAVLMAAASRSGEREWSTWVESKLFDLAVRLPLGRPSKRLRKYLEDLKTVMPVADNVWSRAEAMASLAS